MLRSIRKATIAAALAAGTAHAVVTNTPTWIAVDLGTLGGPGSYGAAVSDTGYVAGCADLADGTAHAFLYDGKMHDLGTGGGDANGSSCALAVNDRGVAAGRSSSGDLVMWSGKSVTPLGVKGTVGGINDLNVIVGAAGQAGATHAFVYSNGELATLGNADAVSEATAINLRGQVAGTISGRAFLYENGNLRDLGTLGGFSSAKGIDQRGQVVGMSTDTNGTPYPFVWSAGSMQRVAAAPSSSGAVDIDDFGRVIGSAEGTYGYVIANGTYTRLDTLPEVVAKGWRHLEPTGINESGWIVGTATDGAGNLRAFLLVPSHGAATSAIELTGGLARAGAPGRFFATTTSASEP
ncbi:MAG TPA: hypothetical protein VH301_07470 [Usitatibacter sp.]|jgi:probable HAF family extracellular repeat protein|nr:hypothetical protein [Usitatibacter sp.]